MRVLIATEDLPPISFLLSKWLSPHTQNAELQGQVSKPTLTEITPDGHSRTYAIFVFRGLISRVHNLAYKITAARKGLQLCDWTMPGFATHTSEVRVNVQVFPFALWYEPDSPDGLCEHINRLRGPIVRAKFPTGAEGVFLHECGRIVKPHLV